MCSCLSALTRTYSLTLRTYPYRPEDVARAVIFLLAGAHCTGSVLELHPEHIPGMLGAGVGAVK